MSTDALAPRPAEEPLRLYSVPAWHGVLWIRRAFEVFRHHPLGFAGLFSSSMLAMMVVLLVPALGMLAVFMAAPWLALGFMQATRHALEGRTPLISVFVEPLRTQPSRVRGLLMLGLSFTLAAVALLVLADLVDGDVVERLLRQSVASKADPQTLAADPQLRAAALLRMGLLLLLAVPFWHAPALVYWGGQPWTRAWVFSVVALWRNKLSFIVFGAGWVALLLLLSVACAVLLGTPALAPLLPLASLLGLTLLASVFCLSTYFSFAGCFWPTHRTDAL